MLALQALSSSLNAGTLKTHTPQIWGVKISPPKFTEWAPKSTVKQVIFEDSPHEFGGCIFTPQIWGVWVVRALQREASWAEETPTPH